jgi:two-component system KDP operon response regulator KdpE
MQNPVKISNRCRLLIVDDEPVRRRVLRNSLRHSDFEVSEARTGEEAMAALRRAPSDILLLDIHMPGMEGLEICRQMREIAPQSGIIMMTVWDSEDDIVSALEAGADDLVRRPCRPRELSARLLALSRRLKHGTQNAAAVLRCGDLELDLELRRVSKRGAEVHLSPKEFDLFAYLFRNRGGTLLHVKILRSVWGLEYGGELEYLRTYVRALRKKIEDDPTRPEYILTEPWVGYRFADKAHKPAAFAVIEGFTAGLPKGLSLQKCSRIAS